MSYNTDPDNEPIDIDEDGEQLGYVDNDNYMMHDLGVQGRMMEPEPDAYLETAYEDRFDIGDHYDF